jgi:hypothetical protein
MKSNARLIGARHDASPTVRASQKPPPLRAGRTGGSMDTLAWRTDEL